MSQKDDTAEKEWQNRYKNKQKVKNNINRE